jgi:hypothetical protein
MEIKEFFYFKGERDYIQAGNIFDSILNSLSDESPNNIDFSLSKFTVNEWKLLPGSLDSIPGPIIGKYKDNSSSIIVAETEERVTRRIPYDEPALVRLFQIKKDHIFIPDHINQYSFIEKVIAGFKALLVESVFQTEIKRFIFVRITLFRIPSKPFSIRFRRIIAGKFYEGEIIENKIKVGLIYFSEEARS